MFRELVALPQHWLAINACMLLQQQIELYKQTIHLFLCWGNAAISLAVLCPVHGPPSFVIINNKRDKFCIELCQNSSVTSLITHSETSIRVSVWCLMSPELSLFCVEIVRCRARLDNSFDVGYVVFWNVRPPPPSLPRAHTTHTTSSLPEKCWVLQ